MQIFFRGRRRILTQLLIFLSILGPGIITSNVDNDAGGITTYSLAGARFGYTLLWSLIPITGALIIVQEMSARMGAVTGRGLGDLIRENFGIRTTVLVMLGLLFINFGNTMAEFSGLAAGSEIFGIPKYIALPIGAALVWFLVVKGTYWFVEKVFLVASLFYISYIFSGLLASPPWPEIGQAIVRPTLSTRPEYMVMLVGLVGTTIAPWMQFYLQSAVVEKQIGVQEYPYSRIDVIVGSVTVSIVAGFIIIACAATIFANNIPVESAKDAALALGPIAGRYAETLFAFGLINASLFSASILPLSTAYSVSEALGFEGGVSKSFRQAPFFFALYTFFIVAGALVVMLPGAPLLEIMFFSQVANGILLPFILIFMLILINNKTIMGDYVNGPTFNWIARATIVVLIILTVGMLAAQLLEVAGFSI